MLGAWLRALLQRAQKNAAVVTIANIARADRVGNAAKGRNIRRQIGGARCNVTEIGRLGEWAVGSPRSARATLVGRIDGL
jgi:hypothetical protein